MNATVGGAVQKARPEVLATGGGERGSRSPLAADSPGSVRRRGVLGAPLRTPFATASYWAHREKKEAFHKPCALGKKERKCKRRDTENRGQGRDAACFKCPRTDRKRSQGRHSEGTWAPPLSLGSGAGSPLSGPSVLSSHGGRSLQVAVGTRQGSGAKAVGTVPDTGGLGTVAPGSPALYSRGPASRATGPAPASSPARSIPADERRLLLPCGAPKAWHEASGPSDDT